MKALIVFFLGVVALVLSSVPDANAQWMNVLKKDSTHFIAEYVGDSAQMVLFRDSAGRDIRIARDDMETAKPVLDPVSSGEEPLPGMASRRRKKLFDKGTSELSLLGGGGSITETLSGSSSSFNITTFSLSVTPAYFVTDGLSIEPEIGVSILSGDEIKSSTAFSFVGNLSYTFIPKSGSVAPFIRAGAGISNGLTFPSAFPSIFGGNNDIGSVFILQAGAGLKFLIGTMAAIRMEIYYKRQSYSISSSYSNTSSDFSDATIGAQLGISVMP
ncbi:MAG TPA: hypothetical protein VEW28_04360 [Candidatus Kapabacteria bacterium]|nr:hypothetical protein [Candidatus Kapabacteria bacterium]